MAAPLWISSVLRITLRGPSLVQAGGRQLSHLSRPAASCRALAPTPTPTLFPTLQVRHGSFFNKLTAEQLWKGVLAETGAGARKGRGKRSKRKGKKDLNRGQRIGEGRGGYLWPGLNTSLPREGPPKLFSQRSAAQQEEVRAEMEQSNEAYERSRRTKVKKERGWTGNSWGGISLGPPEPGPNGETYHEFDSRAIEVKNVFNMTANEGRKRSVSCLVAVGNGQGAAGFAVGKAADRMTALRKAKNKAIHFLYFIERYNDHTIYHDISSTFKRTTLRMKKQNRGYGLHCHRAVITICKLIGIEDMYAKVSGSTNLLNLTRALFQGLATQETHRALSQRTQLHVVEFQPERGPLPIVVATPPGGARSNPEPEDEVPDTRLDWAEVRATQGTKRSVWANVKRTVW
ncbi:hypothetical protein COCON_G00039520 [Conger conger]|uniref:Small ribosomal subunit protein uS5m n=1 Tax=Conger conger TaxID=82655 RepID=A0A9Q1I660_CONCO|nr:hypothetical protein COCON_G00039520 [Conger conger]